MKGFSNITYVPQISRLAALINRLLGRDNLSGNRRIRIDLKSRIRIAVVVVVYHVTIVAIGHGLLKKF